MGLGTNSMKSASRQTNEDLIAAIGYDKHSMCPSIRSIRTKRCFTMTDMVQVYSNFHSARVFVINSRWGEIRPT